MDSSTVAFTKNWRLKISLLTKTCQDRYLRCLLIAFETAKAKAKAQALELVDQFTCCCLHQIITSGPEYGIFGFTGSDVHHWNTQARYRLYSLFAMPFKTPKVGNIAQNLTKMPKGNYITMQNSLLP